MLTPEQYSNTQRAERLQATADTLTSFRKIDGLITGPAMAVCGQSWPLAIAETAGGITDAADGWLAKKAKTIVGHSLNPDGADDDREADKIFTYSGLAGTIFRDVLDGHMDSAVFVSGITALSAIRDAKIQEVRSKSDKKESSILLNRIGTVVRIGSLCLGMSPLGKSNSGRRIRNVGLGISTAIAGVGYFQTKNQLK